VKHQRTPCACGCGQLTNDPRADYIYEHIPREMRQAWGRKGRERGVLLRRFRLFRKDLDQLLADGRRLTRGELLATLANVYERGLQAGYHAVYRNDPRPKVIDILLQRLETGPKRRTELGDNVQAVACALSKLKARGLVRQVSRGVWELVPEAKDIAA
jgi:hypothetical protein